MGPPDPAVLAIDFGTANTVAVLFDGKSVDKVTDSSGHVVWPSAVFYSGELPLKVGWDAVALGVSDPDCYKSGIKRELGMAGRVPLGGRGFDRTELVAQVLAFLRENAEQRVGRGIRSAVLTVPAAYDEYLCSLMIEAAERSRLEVVTLTEPEGAAYSEGAVVGERPILVYDFGAGTFDAAVVEPSEVGFQVVGHSGLSQCGGLDVDQIIYRHLCSLATEPSQLAVLDGSDVSPQAPGRRLRVTEECRRQKELLSTVPRVRGNSLLLDPPLVYELTREWLESAVDGLLRETTDCCRALLRDCGLEPNDLGHVLLVGGSSRMPAVSRIVQAQLGCETRLARVPETAVAEGAARWAWMTRYGLADAPPAPPPGPAGSAADTTQPGATVADEDECFDVVLAKCNGSVAVIKQVCRLTGLGVSRSAELVRATPVRILAGVDADTALKAGADLEEAGAVVSIEPGRSPQRTALLTTVATLLRACIASAEVPTKADQPQRRPSRDMTRYGSAVDNALAVNTRPDDHNVATAPPPPAVFRERQRRNRELLTGLGNSAARVDGLFDVQLARFVRTVNGSEKLIALLPCARGSDMRRRTALLLTSERLLSSRYAFLAESWTEIWWADVTGIGRYTAGGGGVTITANGATQGFDSFSRWALWHLAAIQADAKPAAGHVTAQMVEVLAKQCVARAAAAPAADRLQLSRHAFSNALGEHLIRQGRVGDASSEVAWRLAVTPVKWLYDQVGGSEELVALCQCGLRDATLASDVDLLLTSEFFAVTDRDTYSVLWWWIDVAHVTCHRHTFTVDFVGGEALTFLEPEDLLSVTLFDESRRGALTSVGTLARELHLADAAPGGGPAS